MIWTKRQILKQHLFSPLFQAQLLFFTPNSSLRCNSSEWHMGDGWELWSASLPAAPSSPCFSSAPVWVRHGLQSFRNLRLCQCRCSTGCRGISAPPWSTAFSSFSDLGVCTAVSLFFFPLLHPVQCFLPFLKHVFTEVPPVWLTGSPVSCGGSAGASWNRLEPVVSSQRQPLPPARCQHLTSKPNTYYGGSLVQNIVYELFNEDRNAGGNKDKNPGLVLPNWKFSPWDDKNTLTFSIPGVKLASSSSYLKITSINEAACFHFRSTLNTLLERYLWILISVQNQSHNNFPLLYFSPRNKAQLWTILSFVGEILPTITWSVGHNTVCKARPKT